MPRSKLAMVAAVGSHEGPWSYVNGANNIVVEVRGLGDAVELGLERQRITDRTRVDVASLKLGNNAVGILGWLRYRVVKVAPENDSIPTTVEIFPDVDSH